jgi:hypothetical protein
MFPARSAAIHADYPRPGPAVDKYAAIETFVHYAAFKTDVTCAAFLAAGG